ncbi:ROK family protein [Bermanella marisrubri]|nr:ROK family protein [Bermanella marisrubri]
MHLGIDLGGTKIEVAAITSTGECLLRERITTPKHPNKQTQYEQILSSISKLVDRAETDLKQTRLTLGVGIPGTIEKHSQRVKNANTVCLIGQPLQDDLEFLLKRRIAIENDANCFAYSETHLGVGKETKFESLFAVILGTGVGGAWVVNGQVISGANGIAGEWGHNCLPWLDEKDKPLQNCYCGKQGCIETYLSGPGYANLAQQQFGITADSHFLFSKKDHDTSAGQAYKDYCLRLAKSLAHVINIMDPNCIVLGGGLSNIDSLYEDVPKIWKNYIFSAGSKTKINTQLLKNKLGDSSGVFGAALLGAKVI